MEIMCNAHASKHACVLITDVLEEAKGGILFIDEAHNLGDGQFGKEACDTIVAAMTSEEFKDVMIVIAGYPSEIHGMLDSKCRRG